MFLIKKKTRLFDISWSHEILFNTKLLSYIAQCAQHITHYTMICIALKSLPAIISSTSSSETPSLFLITRLGISIKEQNKWLRHILVLGIFDHIWLFDHILVVSQWVFIKKVNKGLRQCGLANFVVYIYAGGNCNRKAKLELNSIIHNYNYSYFMKSYLQIVIPNCNLKDIS